MHVNWSFSKKNWSFNLIFKILKLKLLLLLTKSNFLQDEGSILEGFAKSILDASLCWRV